MKTAERTARHKPPQPKDDEQRPKPGPNPDEEKEREQERERQRKDHRDLERWRRIVRLRRVWTPWLLLRYKSAPPGLPDLEPVQPRARLTGRPGPVHRSRTTRPVRFSPRSPDQPGGPS